MIAFRGGVRAFAGVLSLSLALCAGAANGQARAPKTPAGKSSKSAPSAAPVTSAAPAPALDPGDPAVPLAPIGQQESAGAARYGIVLPPEKIDGIETHWAKRLSYLRDRDERRADDEEQIIRQLKEDLELDDLFGIGSALVRESDDARAAGAGFLARKRCELAIALAPGLPAAYQCEVRALLSESMSNLRPAFSAAVAAARAAARDVRLSHAIIANTGTVLLVGFLLAGAVFALLIFVRYAKLYFHDVHHLFPGGARRWQTAILGAAMVLSPLLFQLGPVPLVFTVLAAAALYATALEIGVGAVVMLGLAVAPFAVEELAKTAAFGGPAADIWMVERGEGTAAALTRLQLRLEQPNVEFPVAFALARRAKREGDLATAEKLYRKALTATGLSSDLLAATHNNLGNVELLLGDVEGARAQYSAALELRETLAPAHFNLSRTLGLAGVEQLEKVQAEQARALDLDRADIDAFTGGSLQVNRKANRFLMDVRLPSASLQPLRDAEAARAESVGDEARSLLGGFPSVELAPILPIAGALLLIFIFTLRTKVKPSGRCERCGREVCKRCDADARPSEALCAQCVNVYIRRNSVEPIERQRKEKAVEVYRRRRTLLLRAVSVLSGASHILMGHPLAGLIFLLLTSLLASSLLLWSGVVHTPNAVRAGASIFRTAITIALFFIVYGLCLRDFLARQRAEG